MPRRIGDFYTDFSNAEVEAISAEDAKQLAISRSNEAEAIKTAKAMDLSDALMKRPFPERSVLVNAPNGPFVLVPTPDVHPGFRIDALDTEDTEVGGDTFVQDAQRAFRATRR